MNWQIFNNSQFIENVGWALTHSFWQISLIALLLFFSLRILKNAPANLRYLFCILALFLTIAMPVATFLSFSASSAIEDKANFVKPADNRINYSTKAINKNNKTSNVSNNAATIETARETGSQETFGNLQNQAGNLFASLLPYFVWFWFIGVLFFFFRFGGGIWHTYQLKTRKISFIAKEWQEKFDGLCEKIGVHRAVKILQSEIVETPMVIGWLKPLVILPSSVLSGLNPRELETIIAHELIHIRRHDYLVNILQSSVEAILFFHPLAWWISAQVRRERENACDDEVLKLYDTEPLLYANALANLEDFRFRTNNLTPSNIVAANGGNLMLRIQRIVKRQTKKSDAREPFRSIIPVFLFVATFLSGVLLAGWQIAANKGEIKSNVNTKKIAVGLYAASTVIPSENPPEEDEETMRLVIAKLKQHNIPTTGFLKGVKVNIRAENIPPDQERIINLWREAGFEIGVLDLKHPQSFNSTIAEYQAAIKSREGKLEPYLKKQIEFFKETKKSDRKKLSEEDLKKQMASMKETGEEIKNVVKEWMKENNLTSVKYTLGIHDWIYSYTYDVVRKENDREMMSLIKTRYIDHMSKSLEHYEKYAQQLFERDVPQTISLTPSRLLADSADELFAIIQNHGYQFVSMDEAMQDEAYQSSSVFSNGTGSSWLESLALKEGKPFLNKPNVDLDVLKIWEENQSINLKVIEK